MRCGVGCGAHLWINDIHIGSIIYEGNTWWCGVECVWVMECGVWGGGISARVCVCVCACVRACVCVCVRTCAYVGVSLSR